MRGGLRTDTGTVQIFYGTSANGLQFTSPNDELWTQDSGTILDAPETLDRFGYALVAGQMDNDAYDDLAIGIIGEHGNEGAVAIIRGDSSGTVDTSNILWEQDEAAITGTGESGDGFGSALGFGLRYDDGDAIGALVVGVPGEDSAQGVIEVIYLDNTSTPTIAVSELWRQDDISGTNENGETFGQTLFQTRQLDFNCIAE